MRLDRASLAAWAERARPGAPGEDGRPRPAGGMAAFAHLVAEWATSS